MKAETRSRPMPYLLLLPVTLLLILFFVLPVANVIRTSFLTFDIGARAVLPLTQENYIAFFSNATYMNILTRTIRIAAVVTSLLLFIGYPLALYLSRASPSARGMIFLVILAPLLISVIARSYAWLVILAPSGLINQILMGAGLARDPAKLMYTEGAIVIGLAYICLPYMVLSIDAAIRLIDPRLELAAQSLGSSSLSVFWHVTLPLSMPGLVSGSVIVFALSASSYITPALLGGSFNRVLSSLVYEQTMVIFNQPFGSAIAISFMIITTVLIGTYMRITRRHRTAILAG
jgi:putative spermidine/putrescine transport system permease protein